MFTTQPSPYGSSRVAIFKDGQFICDTPTDQAAAAIQHHVDTTERHWQAVRARRHGGDARLVITDGHVYSIGSSADYPKGFGGQWWLIQFYDGRSITTDSLWHMGDIPADWRERLPENATLRALR